MAEAAEMNDSERCPNCGEELRLVKNVGWVHYSKGAYRLCPNPPQAKTA